MIYSIINRRLNTKYCRILYKTEIINIPILITTQPFRFIKCRNQDLFIPDYINRVIIILIAIDPINNLRLQI